MLRRRLILVRPIGLSQSKRFVGILRAHGRLIHGNNLVAGAVTGEALITDQPLSSWGDNDYGNGIIIDRRRPLNGESACDRI